jgi:hypothetical protein|tara:strand:+ start:2030 stop:2761 length:732 start_codon:yes stop_codon:yes gene_type:complete
MRKILITSGDSWTHSSFHDFPKWPDFLAKKLEMRLVNVGEGARGNEFIHGSMIDSLCQEKNKNIGLAVCLWSSFDRWDFIKDTIRINPKSIVGPFWEKTKISKYVLEEFKALHDVLTQHEMIDGIFNAVRSLRFYYSFQCYCELNQIPYIHAQNFYPTEVDDDSIIKSFLEHPLFNHINENHFLWWPIFPQIGGETMSKRLNRIDPDKTELRISKEDTHPNRKGQEYISEIIYEEYKKIYIKN